MNILSLFDGISALQVALNRAGIKYDNYYASEIDKYAIQITQKNYPNTIQLGDVANIKGSDLPHIHLLCGGSPCQSLSCAAGQKESGLEKGKSVLFWKYVRVLNECQPDYFIFENVASMKQSDRDRITEILGVEPILINSALLSAQQRKRLYWTNIKGIKQPKDKHIYLKDVLINNENEIYRFYTNKRLVGKSITIGSQVGSVKTIMGQGVITGYTDREKSYCITATYNKSCHTDLLSRSCRQLIFTKPIRVSRIGKGDQEERIYSVDGKSICLSANGGGRGTKTGLHEIKPYVRKLMPVECERLQTFPDNFTEGLSDAQRYKCLGNSFTVDVIVHILKNLNTVSIQQRNLSCKRTTKLLSSSHKGLLKKTRYCL